MASRLTMVWYASGRLKKKKINSFYKAKKNSDINFEGKREGICILSFCLLARHEGPGEKGRGKFSPHVTM